MRVSKIAEQRPNLVRTRSGTNLDFNLWLFKAAKNARQTIQNLLLTCHNSKKNRLLKTFNMFLRILFLYKSLINKRGLDIFLFKIYKINFSQNYCTNLVRVLIISYFYNCFVYKG